MSGKVSERVMISNDGEAHTPFKVAAPFAEGFDDPQEFLLSCGVIALGRCVFRGEVSNRTVVLNEDSTTPCHRCIRDKLIRLGGVSKCQTRVGNKYEDAGLEKARSSVIE